MIGKVRWYNITKGYGFIAPENGGKDVFVHVSAVQKARLGELKEGETLGFDVEPSAKGNNAVNLFRV